MNNNEQLPEGKILVGQYEIKKSLGRGGFGETYLAIDKLKMNSSCVIKRLKPKKTEPDILEAARTLFKREAKSLYQLRCDRIPRLLADFEQDGEFYLAQELIEGEDLKKELERVKRLSETQVIALLVDVLTILKFVHQHHVIHRDIKPSNLIRRQSDSKIVLIDFGAVKQISVEETTSDALTSSTVAIGTKGYMANEVLGGKPRRSSDIYALGITAIHALTGKDPGKDDPPELEQDPRTGELIWRKHANVNNRLATILDKMVKSHFRDRYQEVDEVLEDLQKLQNSWENTVSAVSTFTSTIATKKLPSLQFPKFKYIFAVLVAIGLVSAIPQLLPSLPKLSVVHSSSNTEALFQEGKKLSTDGKYKEAISVYDKALKHNPKNAHDIWKARAIALFSFSQYEDSLISIDKALELKPNDVDTLAVKSYLLIQVNRFQEAVTISEQALKIDSKSSHAWLNRGWAMSKLKKYQEGLKDIERSLELDAQNSLAWQIKGDIFYNNFQKYEEALIAYNRATNIEPKYSINWFNKGNALLQLKRFQEAIYSYDEAIRNQSNYADAWLGKSIALYKLKRYEETITALDQVIAYKPDNAFAWYGKGQALSELKKYQEAVVAYDKALKFKPDYTEAKEARQRIVAKL